MRNASLEYKVTRLGQREISTTGTEVPTPVGEGWELIGVCATSEWVFWTWTRESPKTSPGPQGGQRRKDWPGPTEPWETP